MNRNNRYIYKTIRFSICTLLMMLFSSCASQKVENQSLMIINGMFFHEKPEQLPAEIVVMASLIKDSVWGDIHIHTYPKELSEAAKKYAIPVEKIKNGEDILKRASNAPKFPTVRHEYAMNLTIGDTFPDFTLYDVKGRQWSNKELKGKKVVINFWFTGCRPCIKEMPELGRWVRKHRDVIFLAVTFESAEKIKDIVKENKFRFHQLVDDESLIGQVGVNSFPCTLVLDEEGKVAHIEVGTTPVQRENILKALE